MGQLHLFPLSKTARDVSFTSPELARDIVRHFKPSGTCLDPCKGDGAFYNHLPAGSEWCEVEQGKDFFQWTQQVDWIVSNPPYSVFYEWLLHSFQIAANIVYLIPVTKVFTSYKTMKAISEYGGIREIYVIEKGRMINFDFGFVVGAVHFQRGYTGGTFTTFAPANNGVQPNANRRRSGRQK